MRVERRKNIYLTSKGREVAEAILRRHFLTERLLFLAERPLCLPIMADPGSSITLTRGPRGVNTEGMNRVPDASRHAPPTISLTAG